MPPTATELKDKGNASFRLADYTTAETHYTSAILLSPSNPLLYTNRAIARLKLHLYPHVLSDCEKSLSLTPSTPNYKAHFYAAQAHLALSHPNDALTHAKAAYEEVLHPTSARERAATSSIASIAAVVISAKRAVYETRLRLHERERGDLLNELITSLEGQRDESLASLRTEQLPPIATEEARTEILTTTQKKMDELRTVFAIADPGMTGRKEIPEWAVDTITFELMHDPVVTGNGHSYERSTILEHLKRSPTDPLTREPLTEKDLRPNIALRKALEEFWEGAGGWAMEW